MDAVALGAVLVAYNNILNRVSWFNGAPFVPVNLAAAAAVVAIGVGPLGLDGGDVGFPVSPGGLVAGCAVGLILAAPLFALGAHPRTARFVADERSAGLAGTRLAYQTLVRVPLGTAVLEEIAFRGVLFALLSSHGTWTAALASSIAFGLWHIMPSLNMLAANRPGAASRTKIIFTAGTVAITTLSGLGFVFLRVETGDIGAPLALHATLNSLATLAAARAARSRRLQLRVHVDDSGQGVQLVDEMLGGHTGR